MVSYVENYDPTDSAALHEACSCTAGLSAHMQRVGMRLKVAVCHMIYRKVSVARYHGVYLP